MSAVVDRTGSAATLAAPAGALTPAVLVSRIGAVLVSNGAYVAGAFVGNVLTANALTPAEFGSFSVATAVMVMVQELCGTGFDLAMVRLAARHAGTARAHQILNVSLRIKLVIAGAASALLFVGAGWVAGIGFGDPRLTMPLQWAAVGVLGTSLFHHALARFQAREEFRQFAALRSGNSVLKVVLLGIFAAAGMLTLQTALGVSVLVLFVGFAVAFSSTPAGNVRDEPSAAEGLWREVLWFGRWMIAAHLLFSLYARLDIVMLGRFGDESAVGYYTVAWNLAFLIDLCTYSVITAMMPHAARITTRAGMWAYGRQTLRACGLMVLLLMPVSLLAGPAIRLLFSDYGPAARVFPVLFVGSLLTLVTHPLYLIVYARDHVELVALSNLILAAVAGVGYWLLIPSMGTMGAAIASVGARAVNGAVVLFLVYRELRVVPSPVLVSQ
jgi:O-antigen/teichoic acid export membrane protein